MCYISITYTREDVLRYNTSHSGQEVDILNHQLFREIQAKKAEPYNNNRSYKTRRGKRAGKHTKPGIARRDYKRGAVLSNLIQVPIHREPQQPTYLPTILYINCRSLNTWKLEELKTYVTIHKPNLICLTETWLDQDKQQLIHIDGYDNHFSNHKNRLGGGVCILSSTNLGVSVISAHTSKTLSTIWILVPVNTFRPLIIGCIYHPPGADQSTTQDHITVTIAKFTSTYPNANYIIMGDFNRLPIDCFSEQYGLSNLVNFHTRGNATLDLILTDICEYTNAIKLSPLDRNDHC